MRIYSLRLCIVSGQHLNVESVICLVKDEWMIGKQSNISYIINILIALYIVN